jgi:hypothetical protein
MLHMRSLALDSLKLENARVEMHLIVSVTTNRSFWYPVFQHNLPRYVSMSSFQIDRPRYVIKSLFSLGVVVLDLVEFVWPNGL